MEKKFLKRYAEVMLWALEIARKSRGGSFQKGDIVLLQHWSNSINLAEMIYPLLLQRGFNVVVETGKTPSLEHSFYEFGSDQQIKYLPIWDQVKYQMANGLISLRAPADLTHLADIDSQKMSLFAVGRKPVREILDAREAMGHFGWTLNIMATPRMAEIAGLTMEEYEDEIIKSCYLDCEDPVAKWEELHQEAQEIISWLNSLDVEYFHVEAKNTDLKVYPGEKRKWIGVSGHNIPSFEFFTSPDCEKTSGKFFANTKCYRDGQLIENVSLEFQKGKVIRASAEQGEEYLQEQLKVSGGNQVGEFSLTDKKHSPISKFMANTLFDENVGQPNGNSHIALGCSFPDAFDGPVDDWNQIQKEYHFNNSAIHWDLISTEQKKVTAHLRNGDVLVIYEDGSFIR